jgi:hypothetical protein
MRFLSSLPFLVLLFLALPGRQAHKAPDQPQPLPGKFTDVTAALGLHFQYLASHTAKHYLPETMGAGVALFDYDNDGRLDIFLVNGAPLSDPTPKGSIPQKSGPQYWNRLFHQKPDGTFVDVTEKAGLEGSGYGMGVAVGDYDNDGWKDLLIAQGHDLDTIELNYPNLHYREPMLLLRNMGRDFADVSKDSGAVFHQFWVGRGMAIGDIDNDGRIDAVVTATPSVPKSNSSPRKPRKARNSPPFPPQAATCHRATNACISDWDPNPSLKSSKSAGPAAFSKHSRRSRRIRFFRSTSRRQEPRAESWLFFSSLLQIGHHQTIRPR